MLPDKGFNCGTIPFDGIAVKTSIQTAVISTNINTLYTVTDPAGSVTV